MAKDGFLGHFNGLAWPNCDTSMSLDPLQHCFMNVGWETALASTLPPAVTAGDPSAHFDSALCSLVSSPSSHPAADGGVVIRELIGRLGNICGGGGAGSGDVSSPSSRYASCYSTPVSSPPKPSLQQFASDPGFVERAARLSCFGAGAGGGKLSRVASSQSLLAATTVEAAAEAGAAQSAANDGLNSDSHGRKRKASAKGKGKEPAATTTAKFQMPDVETNAKKCKLSTDVDGGEKDEEMKPKAEQNGEAGQGKGKESNVNPPEPPKDYIHVRARRGQATDSHSLAERVRREKISERMKLLQDLVPGCNKVTGKAVMLDEIINYVQSLQRQVEFLSMKLATVNPRLDFHMENFLSKDVHQSCTPMPPSAYSLEASSSAFSYASQPQGTPIHSVVTNGMDTQCSLSPMDSGLRRNLGMPHTPLDGFESANSQIGNLWEDDLQSVVQMGFGHSQEAAFTTSEGFRGLLQSSHLKIGL